MRIGSAHVDITPGPDVSLLGYDFRQAQLPAGNAGVADRLAVHALVLETGDQQRAVFIDCDLCILSVSFARAIRSAVAEALGCGLERVLLCCSHTHSGPWLREPRLDGDLAKILPHGTEVADGTSPGQREAARLPERVLEAVRMAAGLTMPAELRVREVPLGVAYCRRVVTGAGIRHCWNPDEAPDLSLTGSADPTLTLLDFRQRSGPRRWPLFAFGAHPVCLGKTSRVVSADWPGRTRRLIGEWLPGAEAFFALGACGDTHAWIATQERHERLEPVARAVAAQVCLLAEAGGQAERPDAVRAVGRRVELGGADLDLVAWQIGSALLVAAPVELFAGLGAELRRRLGRPVLLATNANGWTGYWPDAAAFAAGAYEVDAARAHGREAGDGEALIDQLVDLVGELPSDAGPTKER